MKKSNQPKNLDFSLLFSKIMGETVSTVSPSFDYLGKLDIFPKNLMKELEQTLNLKINNPDYYKLALLHSSIIPFLQKKFGQGIDFDLMNNERLEFLGDSVFNFIISEQLYLNITSKDEGVLSMARAKLINRPILGEVARKLSLEDFIQTSYNARSLIDSGNLSILSNALEAIIGAVYLDKGFEQTKLFILNIIVPILADCHATDTENYKSILMEAVQAEGKSYPVYSVLGEIGPDHQKKFLVGVYVENKLLGTAIAGTKKEAEQIAAKKVLDLLDNK